MYTGRRPVPRGLIAAQQGGSVPAAPLTFAAASRITATMEFKNPLQEDIHFRVLDLLRRNPDMTQRRLAAELGVSAGKVNYLLAALIAKGYIKIDAFRRGRGKLGKVAYLLTRKGLQNRLALTRTYLDRKTREYEMLRTEIEALRSELAKSGPATEKVTIKGNGTTSRR
jgi:EPS-associated MarR family transcriptional regulator